MAHYIDKDALVAEIERLIAALKVECDRSMRPQFTLFGKINGLESCLTFINTLEVKEVDLEKEIQNVIHNHFFDLNGIAIAGTSSYATVDDMVYIAKHFFELGLKAKQG